MTNEWTIYNQSGSTVRATVKELEYHGEWMGDEYVSVTVRSAEPVQFSVGDKLEYRGETFEINYDPNLIKRARSKSYGEAFVYENVRLYSQASRLKDVGFKDYVLNWNSQSNTIPYSSQGTFQFFCGSVEDLADRIQANLDRHTNGLWKVFTPNSVRTGQRHNCGSLWSSYYDGTEDTGKTDVNIEADNLSCLDAVNLSYSAFSLSYYVTNATVSGSVKNIIVIGGAPVSAAHNFRYGKDNGLYEIERTSDDSERIVTKLFAYGSDKNLPLNYYANLGKEIHISIYHKSTREIILGQPDLLLWVNKEWSRSLGSAFAPNYSVTLTSGSLTYKVSVTHDHLNGYDNDRGPLVEDVDYMYFRLWSGDAGAQAFYDAVTAGQTFTVTGVSINKMPEEWIYQPPSYNYPALLSISRLMLPGFPGTSLYSWVASHGGTNLNPTTGRATWRGHTAIFSRDARDPWIMSERSATLGVREGTLNFDGSAGEDEVAPTIEGAVDGAGRRLDEVAWAEQMDDSGFLGEDPEEGLLTFGFMPGGDPDYIDWLDNDGDVTISMKDGACVGREFKMKKAEKNGNGDWELTLNRCYDDSLGRYFPYREEGSNTLFQVVGSGNTHGTMEGNHFVILGISMPGGLVEAASIRLLEKALEQLDKKDHQTFTYIPKIDEIYMQRQDDAVKEGRDAATYGTVSLHDTLHAGMQMEIQDNDLDLHYMPFIDVLTIRENGNNGIPTYDVVLRDEKELTMQQRIQSQIEGGTEAAVNRAEDAYSSSRYLSKIQDDTAQGFIRFIKGLQVGERFVPGLMGEGGVFRKEADGTTYIEADNLYIRMKAYFDTVEIRKFLHTGGNRIATVAGAKCVRVEWLDSSNNVLVQEQSNLSRAVKFRCFFRANDGDNIVTNDFLVGDQAYCHVTRMQSETMEQASEGTGGSMLTTRHYWRLVIGTNVSDDGGRLTEDGEYWIDLSNRASETLTIGGTQYTHDGYQSGSDIPNAQDDIVQLGNIEDTTRQGAIVEFVTGGDSPSYQIFQGIDEFSFVGKNYISLGYATGSTNTHGAGHAYMDLYGDVFIGAKPDAVTGESPTYIKYAQEDPVTGEPKLTIKAVVEFQSPDDPQTTTTLDDFARAVVGDIDNIQSQIDGNIETWFYDYMPVDLDAQDPRQPLIWIDSQHTTPCLPYYDWWYADQQSQTNNERIKHLSDIFYDNKTGYAFRFSNTGTAQSPVFSWVMIEDSAVIKALEDAARAQDTADHKRRVFVAQPAPISPNVYVEYDIGDLWVNATYPSGYSGETDEANHKYNNDYLRCIVAKPIRDAQGHVTDGTFSINDWQLASKYTDDTALLEFLDGYQGTLTTIRNQVDAKAETWYQDEDPSTLTPQQGGWYGGDNAEHVGDIWFCTKNHASPSLFKKGTTWIWQAHTTEHGVSYSWEEQEIPDEVFDKIDGKSSIYANDPNDVDSTKRHPSNYKANDVWILPMIYVNGVLNPSTYTINNITYGAGEMLTALRDNETYSAGDWAKKVRYTDDSALNDFKTNQYVQLLTGGQITSDINSARQTADNAQTAAEAAQTSANNANTKLTDWASDSYISPTEKTALKTEWEDVKTEYTQICNDADKYSIDKTAFTSAYTSANAAFQKYTAATPENITVGSDYQNIKNYYAARQTILNAISDAAKTLAQNAATAYMSDTALNAIKYALNGGSTTQDGGLILSNIIALRDANQNVMSGMNGVYNSQLTSGGIAAWYGGAMTDHEQSPSALNYAKSLFRFDGSGYLAGGNITWDATGAVTIKNITTLSDSQNTNLLNELATFNSAFSFATSGSGSTTVLSITPNVPFTSLSILDTSVSPNVGRPVATQKWVSDNYISIAFFNRLFQAYSSTTISDANKVDANDTTTAINNLKLLVGTWANEYLSALGLNSQQGGGGGDVTWTQLTADNPSTGQQIHPSHLSGVTEPLYFLFNEESSPSITYNGRVNRAVSGILTKSYADGRYYQKIANGSASEVVLADGTSSKLKTINGNSIFGDGDIVVSGGGGSNDRLVSVTNPLNAQVFQIRVGQVAIGTSAGKAYAGSSATYNLWSFPSGATTINSNNTANIQGIRYTWDANHFRDIFMSPNNDWILHRRIEGGVAGDWYMIPQYAYTSGSIGLGSATKPVYIDSNGKLVEANSYPTTLDEVSDGNSRKLSDYLPKSGGTMTGALHAKHVFEVYNGTSSSKQSSYMKFTRNGADGNDYAALGWNGGNVRLCVLGGNGNYTSERETLLIGYDGQLKLQANSGTAPITTSSTTCCENLNADMLDGKHLNGGQTPWDKVAYVGSNGVMEVGRYIDFHYTYNPASTDVDYDFSVRVQATARNHNTINIPSASGTLALTTDNVASATKLQNSRDLWGQPFNGEGNVDGLIKVTANGEAVRFGNNLKYCLGSNTTDGFYLWGEIDTALFIGTNNSERIRITGSGNVGIGTASPSYKLHVSGTLGIDNQITSTLASGTAPISVTSTTVCTNLNADMLDGSHASDFLRMGLSSIELNMYGSLQGFGGFFDFHYNGSTADYTSRIIEDQSGRLNINSVIYAHLGGNVGIGTAPSYKLHVNGTFYASGNSGFGSRASINTTSTTGILNVSRGSTNDYAIDTLGQQRYKYDSGDTSDLSIGLFPSNKCPFIRFTDVLGGYIDVHMVPVTDSGGTIVDSLFSIGKTSHTTRIIARNFRVYTRISSDDSGNTQAMQALMNGRLLVGSADTTLVNGNTDCKFLVNGNMCTSAADGSFIKIGNVYLIYDSRSNSIKVAGNAAGTSAANFYATGAVSALGANTSGGSGTTEYVTLSTGQAISGAKTFTANVQMSADLIPSATNQYYVGTSGRTFLGLYVKNATISGVMEVGGLTYLCSRAFQFSASTDGGGHTLSTVSTNGRSLRIELGSSALNPYVSKPWNEGSDIRRKDIIANASTSVDNVANAPVFNFRYKGDSVNSINLGTSAQYWRNVFPCGVSEMGDGYLAMNYGAIALASAVVVARRVQNHEDRIAYLERENENLRNRIKQLEAA